MKEIRKKARELMTGSCRVCPVCDGRACVGEVPGMGGLGSGRSFQNNVSALADLSLNMRLIHSATAPSTRLNWLGLDLDFPVVASPIGGMFNFNDAISERDYMQAVLAGSKKAGCIGCGGDGVKEEVPKISLDVIREQDGWGIPFIKPWDEAELERKMRLALAADCPAVGMDIDAAGLITLALMGRPVGPKSPQELAEIIDFAHRAGRKFIVKGIMTVQDAELAVRAGADCIAVSNHGGRVLESTPGTARVLPAIARAVGGKVSIMVDGGVRSGADVLKMLALGAEVVGIGRPVSIAAIGGGVEGVVKFWAQIRSELVQAMIMTGCGSLEEIGPAVLHDF